MTDVVEFVDAIRAAHQRALASGDKIFDVRDPGFNVFDHGDAPEIRAVCRSLGIERLFYSTFTMTFGLPGWQKSLGIRIRDV